MIINLKTWSFFNGVLKLRKIELLKNITYDVVCFEENIEEVFKNSKDAETFFYKKKRHYKKIEDEGYNDK